MDGRHFYEPATGYHLPHDPFKATLSANAVSDAPPNIAFASTGKIGVPAPVVDGTRYTVDLRNTPHLDVI